MNILASSLISNQSDKPLLQSSRYQRLKQLLSFPNSQQLQSNGPKTSFRRKSYKIEQTIESEDQKAYLPTIKQNKVKLKKRKKCKRGKFVQSSQNQQNALRRINLLRSFRKYSELLKGSAIQTSLRLKIKPIPIISSKASIMPKRSQSIRSSRQQTLSQVYQKKIQNIRIAKKLVTIQPTEQLRRQELKKFYKNHLSHLKVLIHPSQSLTTIKHRETSHQSRRLS